VSAVELAGASAGIVVANEVLDDWFSMNRMEWLGELATRPEPPPEDLVRSIVSGASAGSWSALDAAGATATGLHIVSDDPDFPWIEIPLSVNLPLKTGVRTFSTMGGQQPISR
jgi:hypothetical protein